MRWCRIVNADRSRIVRVAVVILIGSLVGSACGGGGDGGGDAERGETVSDTEAPTEPGEDDAPGDDGGIIPVGQVWAREVLGRWDNQSWWGVAAEVVEDKLWLVGRGDNRSAILRHDGSTWTETVTGEGDLLALASDGAGTVIGIGVHQKQALLHVSTDGGDTWQSLRPPAMAAPGDSEVYLEGIVHRPGQFLVAGTVRGPDWHARLWSSPDGTDWTLVSEVRGDGHPISATNVLADHDHVVLLAEEHPCAEPHINSGAGGWYIGPVWLNHLRVYQGSDAGSLALAGDGDHPLAADPLELDCSVSVFELDDIAYPAAHGAMVDGTITMLDYRDWNEDDSSRRLAQYVDGVWESETLPETDGGPLTGWRPIAVDGGLALVSEMGTGVMEIWFLLRREDGSWDAVVSDRQILNTLWGLAWHDGALVAYGQSRENPFAGSESAHSPYDLVLLRSVETTADAIRWCEPVAGVDCVSVRAERIAGYPDLSGVDFSGADLAGAHLGSGNYDGATFAGARLLGVVAQGGLDGATFDGADFSGAILWGAELGRADGAVFTDADVSFGRLRFRLDTPVLDGAILRSATISLSLPSDAGDVVIELSLAEADLTDATIRGPFADDQWLVITDLTGAVLEGTRFNDVDLTGISLNGIDLGTVSFNDRSICPDGDPPIDWSCLR